MKSRDGAKKRAPQHEAESTDREQQESDDNRWRKMILREPDVNFVPARSGT